MLEVGERHHRTGRCHHRACCRLAGHRPSTADVPRRHCTNTGGTTSKPRHTDNAGTPTGATLATSPGPATLPAPAPSIVQLVSPPTGASDLLDADDDDAPAWFRTLDNIFWAADAPGLAERELAEELLLACDDEPASFAEAQKCECWRQRQAMLDEMMSIESNGTWELMDPPPRQRPIGLKWV